MSIFVTVWELCRFCQVEPYRHKINAAHLRYLTKPLLTCFWKKKKLIVQALQFSEFNEIKLFWSPQIYGQAFFFWRWERLNNILKGGDIILLKCKKMLNPILLLPRQNRDHQDGERGHGQLVEPLLCSKNKFNELKPRPHDRELWFLCLYLFAQSLVVLAGTATELQLVTQRLFFPLSPPTDSWELNWTIFFFCCQPGRGCFWCSWNQHHGQKFPSFLTRGPVGAFPGSRSEMTQRFCALQLLFFIISFFCNCIEKEVGSSISTFGEKKPQQSPGCQLHWWALTFCSFQGLI